MSEMEARMATLADAEGQMVFAMANAIREAMLPFMDESALPHCMSMAMSAARVLETVGRKPVSHDDCLSHEPTHWEPLPAPPEAPRMNRRQRRAAAKGNRQP